MTLKRFDVALRKGNAVFVDSPEGPAVSYADYEELRKDYRKTLEALLKSIEFMEKVVNSQRYAYQEQAMVRESKARVIELLATV